MSSPLVLVVESDPFDLRALQEACESAGCRVRVAGDAAQALGMLARERPDVLVVDARLPDGSGVDVLRVVKGDGKLAAIPVLVVVDLDDEATQRGAVELGADDWITRPFRVFEVQQRMRRAVKLARATSRREAQEVGEGGRGSEPELVDAVTRAGTEAQLLVTLDYEFTRAARFGHPLSCVIARADGLDALREREGQAPADAALARFAAAVRGSLRTVDHVFRSGPAQLSLVLVETDAEGAAAVHARLREAEAAGELFEGRAARACRLALGAASLPHPAARSGAALHRAAVLALR